MAKLIYAMIASLDGYVADPSGNFDWAAPDEEVHAFANELERPLGTHLYGRRMYETMVAWETMDLTGEPPVVADFAAIWRAADKVVYSRTQREPASARTRIEPAFDPAAVRELKASSDRDLGIGGPELAAQALRAGLVDECHVLLVPVLVGAGTPALPASVHRRLALLDQRRFGNGTVHLHYSLAG